MALQMNTTATSGVTSIVSADRFILGNLTDSSRAVCRLLISKKRAPCITLKATEATVTTASTATTATTASTATTEAATSLPLPLPPPPSIRKRSVWINPKLKEAGGRPFTEKYAQSSRAIKLESLIQSLNDCPDPSVESLSAIFGSEDGKIVSTSKEVAFVINRVTGSERIYNVLQYFRSSHGKDGGIPLDVFVYNLALKRLKIERDWLVTEKVMEQLLEDGIQPDNYTFTTLLSCCRQCQVLDKAVYWYERMTELGCTPDTIVFSNMLDIYSRAGKVEEAMVLYRKVQSQNLELDTLTFSRLIRLLCFSGDYQSAVSTFNELRAKGVKPDVHCYNRVFDALAKLNRQWQIKALQKQMLEHGVTPNRYTCSTLLRAYSNLCLPDDAMYWFTKLKEGRYSMDTGSYNHIISMCADIKRVDDGVKLFTEMSESEYCKPDAWTYSAMISLYSNAANMDDAKKMFDEMQQAGIKPNLFNFTSMIQGYGRAHRFDDVLRTFEQLLEEGISPDYRLCGSLLSFIRYTEGEDHEKIISCIERCNPRLASVAKLLMEEGTDMEVLTQDLKSFLMDAPDEARKPFCNLLIDVCRRFKFPERAHQVMDLARPLNIYSQLQSKSSIEWTLNLKTLSLGAAFTSLEDWFSELSEAFNNEEKLPESININTGHGRQKDSDRSLVTTIENHLKEIQAPFVKDPIRAGWFRTTKDELKTWIESQKPEPTVI